MSKMEKIERGYATIYIDREGETLDDSVSAYWTKEMEIDYYKNPGAIQWNYYLIIPQEVLPKCSRAFENPNSPTEDELKKLKSEITNNDSYGRKYVLPSNIIDLFITDNFPKHGEDTGKILLLKGINRKDTKIKLKELGKSVRYRDYVPIDSFHRNLSSMSTLYELDKLRKYLLRKPDMKVLFYTHIGLEHNLAKQKFDFLSPEIITTNTDDL
jgi:hypothetical protein